MTIFKQDHPRSIDHVIDYFGDDRRAGGPDLPPPAAVRPALTTPRAAA